MAQALIRLVAVGTYDEQMTNDKLYNEYFGGRDGRTGLSGTKRGSSPCLLCMGSFLHSFRPEEEDILVGAIGCQADKTLEAVRAFLSLLEDMPINRPTVGIHPFFNFE